MSLPTAPARRVSVPPADRFFLLGEGRRPAPVGVLGFSVEGESPDRDRLAAAVESALALHPKATSRLASDRGLLGERLFWEHVPDIAPRVLRFHEPDEFPKDREAIEALYSRLVNDPLDARSGPTLEVHAFPTDGDRGMLVLRYHHALGDGYGLLHFIQDLLAAYNGEVVAAPAAGAEPDAAVPGGLRLLASFARFLSRRRRVYGTAPPEKLYDVAREATRRGEVAIRVLEPERTARLRAAARAHGVRVNDLIIAAWSLGIEAWKREGDRACGTFRFMVNRGLRALGGEKATFDNTSSAFPLWVSAEDRRDREALLRRIRDQHQEALDLYAPEGIRLLHVFLRLPLPLLRRAMDRRIQRPEESETLIVSNLGALPVATSVGEAGMRLGRGLFTGTYASIRAPMGPGALLACMSTGGRLVLSLSFMTGLLERPEVERLLDSVEKELDAYGAAAS